MWPILLDMTKDECRRTLRRLELEAYGNIVSALRAQGGLSTEKHKLLQEIATTLNIPQERHRAEIRRAVNDERLATIAHCMTGDDTSDEWALEGRRLVPLMPRLVPQTAYSVIADDEANKVSLENEKLPLPANTERKRPLQTNITETVNKNVHFRVPSESTPKASIQNSMEEIICKKRKTNMNMESSSLAQHLMMGQPKISRVQQLYRQKTKALLKSQMKHRGPPPILQVSSNVQKLNVNRQDEDTVNTITEVPIPLPKQSPAENKVINPASIASLAISNENQIPKPKPTIIHTTTVKPTGTSTNNVIVPQQAPVVSSTSEVAQPQKSIKICPARKVITTTARTQTQPQKVIIVSTSQGTTTSSILQRTLTIPFVKTISMKNLDKVKVINNTVNLQNSPGTTNVSSTTNQKPKLLTVQTKVKGGTPTKHVSIPFIQGVQLQALQNKGTIKMLPLTTSAKGTSKPAIINTTSGSVYIMNSNTTLPIVTASNSSPVVTAKTDTKNSLDPEIKITEPNIIVLKNELIRSALPVVSNQITEVASMKVDENKEVSKVENKSSVLAEILKASGVIPNDDLEQNDIESQITQLTAIPNSSVVMNEEIVQNIVEETVHAKFDELNLNIGTLTTNIETIDDNIETEIANIETINANLEINSNIETIIQENSHDVGHYEQTAMDITEDPANYVILQENEDQNQTILLDDNPQTNEEVVELMGSLDPETGLYSMKTQEEYDLINDVERNQSQNPTDSYVIEMESLQNSELDMPSLSN